MSLPLMAGLDLLQLCLASVLTPGKVPEGLKFAAGMHNAHDAF